MLYIGERPTLHLASDLRLEVNLFDFDKDIYDETIHVDIIDYVRGDKKLSDLAALQAQIEADKTAVKQLLKQQEINSRCYFKLQRATAFTNVFTKCSTVFSRSGNISCRQRLYGCFSCMGMCKSRYHKNYRAASKLRVCWWLQRSATTYSRTFLCVAQL